MLERVPIHVAALALPPKGRSMDSTAIVKSTRHQKIIGTFGELLICNWFSRSGFEVAILDHTGIDIIAFDPHSRRRLGITVKSRTRRTGREDISVNVFSYQKGKDDRQKALAACEAFGCELWIAVYVEATNHADVFLTSEANYNANYRRPGRAIDDWKMGPTHRVTYASDPAVKHIRITFDAANWGLVSHVGTVCGPSNRVLALR
jgi:hypothetical protein